MKFAVIVIFISLAVSLSDGRAAGSPKSIGREAVVSQKADSAELSAWADCQRNYGGRRGFLGRDRYAFIEQCFKLKTGKYPAQLQLNCKLRGC